MKAILVRSKETREVLGGAIIIHKDRVIPFMNPLLHRDFKSGNFKHYLDSNYISQNTLEGYKRVWASDGRIFFQEVVSNG